MIRQLELELEYPETPEEAMRKKWRYEAMARLPVYTPLYHKYFNLIARCYRLDQDFNCHTFIQKKNLRTGKYIGGWIEYDKKRIIKRT